MNVQTILDQAIKAKERAHTPYSHLEMGAAVFAKNNHVFRGRNTVFAFWGLAICAEKTAAFKAVSEGKREIATIVVVADAFGQVSPCGAYRRVMAKFYR